MFVVVVVVVVVVVIIIIILFCWQKTDIARDCETPSCRNEAMTITSRLWDLIDAQYLSLIRETLIQTKLMSWSSDFRSIILRGRDFLSFLKKFLVGSRQCLIQGGEFFSNIFTLYISQVACICLL